MMSGTDASPIDLAFARYEQALERQRLRRLAERRKRQDAEIAASIPVLPW